jgi:hypothetical protein
MALSACPLRASRGHEPVAGLADARPLAAVCRRRLDRRSLGFQSCTLTVSRPHQRSIARRLDVELNRIWSLGDNIVLGWTRVQNTLLVLSCPNDLLPDYAEEHASVFARRGELPRALFGELAADRRFAVHRVPFGAKDATGLDAGAFLDRIIRRYGITLVEQHAVVLFDIVAYSKLTDLQRVAQLNSLSCSVNVAHKQLMGRGIRVDLARSTTGDGFYMWNRNDGADANLRLFALAILALADNAFARGLARRSVVPVLRAAYHIGSHFEFYQSIGLTPEVHEYIVGDTTITLARFLERLLPGQVAIGEFATAGQATHRSPFLAQALDLLSRLSDVETKLAKITRIECRLSARPAADGTPTRFIICDKHGNRLPLFNLRCIVERHGGESVAIGLAEDALDEFIAERDGESPGHRGAPTNA